MSKQRQRLFRRNITNAILFIIIAITLNSCGILKKREKPHIKPYMPEEDEKVYLKELKRLKGSRKTLKFNSDREFYEFFSERLRVKLEGKENKQLIEETYWWIGTPYKYGGDSKRGIDCSGLVKNIFKTVYKTELKRNADDIMRETEITDRKSLRDGDLVFFRINEEKKATHVGIFLNDNKFLHSTIQKGVIISDMEEPYYLKSYFRGGRIKSINN